MIDPADQITQALPLDEQPAKKRRGRPSTGKAMTPAEKQRAYRERQKEAAGNAAVNKDQSEYIERLLAEIEALSKETRRLRVELKSQKAVTKTAPGDGVWTPRFKVKGSRTWVNCDPQVDFEGVPWSYEHTKKHVQEMQAMQKNITWQAVREDGLIYDPKAAK
jgi:hypothetical protein